MEMEIQDKTLKAISVVKMIGAFILVFVIVIGYMLVKVNYVNLNRNSFTCTGGYLDNLAINDTIDTKKLDTSEVCVKDNISYRLLKYTYTSDNLYVYYSKGELEYKLIFDKVNKDYILIRKELVVE